VIEGRDAAGDNADGRNPSWRPVGSPKLVAADDLEAGGPPGSSGERLLPLSAKTPGALKQLAQRYLDWIDEHGDELAGTDAATDPLLSDMAWTASTGRGHFSQRAAVVFRDAESLRQQLRAVLEAGGEGVPEHRGGGVMPQDGDGLVEVLAAQYAEGRTVSFERLYSGEARRRISLPDYPFQRNRYWADENR